MPNGYEHKEYGEHKYHGNSDCEYGCGCWMGSSNSGGPTGLDPFGTCPNNPKDGVKRGGTIDYDDVVTQRIQDWEERAVLAEGRLKTVRPSKIKLAERIEELKEELSQRDQLLNQLRRLLEPKIE